MTILDYFLHEEASYWSMQALLRKAICKGKWVLLYGSRVIAVSETKDEIVRFFGQFKEKLENKNKYPGAIYVQVGNENKFYRIPMDQDDEEETETKKEQSSKTIERVLYR
ncbi:hypothetical protein CEE45_01155 [Candidatus Heimdallarchaeota archaeon B3_Heim]|nr:MAG: hypothetical protein CEE45_01155 [Candidatus Heimdallarchaeota archaeon B3_Heim]